MTRIALLVCLLSVGCGSDSDARHGQDAQRINQRQDAIEQARKDAAGKPAKD